MNIPQTQEEVMRDPALAEIIQQGAARRWEQNHANLVACFDPSLYSKIVSFLQLEGLSQETIDDYNVASLMSEIDRALVTLWKRGALASIQKVDPLPEMAQRELLTAMGEKLPAVLSPAKKAAQERESQLAECISDYNGGLSSADFKAKWMGLPARRAVFEAAIAAGRV